MRICQLTQRFPPAIGGVETHVLQLASFLQRLGESVKVITTDLVRDIPFERFRDIPDAFPFPVRRCRAVKWFELPHGLGIAAPGMVQAIAQTPVDIVHAHAYGYFPMLAASLVDTLRHIPFVATSHSGPGAPTASKRIFDGVVPRFTLFRASRVIAVTRAESNYLNHLGVDESRLRVVPNGIDLAEFTDMPTSRPSRERMDVIFVGRWYLRQKGIEHLIRALARLPSDIRLRVIGEDWGGLRPLTRLVKLVGVEDRVRFEGPITRRDLIAAYSSADALVLPSLFEPFGIVLLEAMAAGIPVVASRIGGIPEIVAESETGILVPPADEDALAAALLRLRDRKTRERMGEAGRRRAAAYSWDVIVPRILEVYREALDERRG